MTLLVTADRRSTAPAAAFYDRWIDHRTWADWSPDTAWVRMDGDVRVGATGTLKPRGGPRVRFVVSDLVPGRRYVDTARFPGARLVFAHTATEDRDGTALTAEVRLAGPLARLWALVLGGGFRRSVPADLDRLVGLVERARADV